MRAAHVPRNDARAMGVILFVAFLRRGLGSLARGASQRSQRKTSRLSHSQE
jgi:hypothetical protein